MFRWNAEMVRFMRAASEYGDYHRRLAQWLLPHLHPQDAVCDAGCGLGYLSLELSPYVRQITAADQSGEALSVLAENCAARDIQNIHLRPGDIFSAVPERPYDAMVFSFFGRMEEIAAIARAQCRGAVLAFKKNYATHRFSAERHPVGDDSFAAGKAWLTAHGVPFTQEELELEMGQPLVSMDEARRFFALYSRDDDPAASVDDFLQKHLVQTGRWDFPLYLPHKRSIGCLKFSAEDL